MDIKTLLTCLFVINLFMGFYTLVIKKTQPAFAGINFWIVSSFFISAGYLFMSQRNYWSDFLSIVVCQMLFCVAGIMRVYGLLKFFHKKTWNYQRMLVFAGVLLYLFMLVYFTYVYKSMFIRTLFVGVVLSGLSLIIGLQTLVNRPSKWNYTYIFTSVTFFTFSFIFLVRIVIWIFFPAVRGLFVSSFINNLQFIASMVIDIAWATMFFVIHNQRLTNQIQESEEKFRAIFTQNSSSLALIDYDSTINMVNDAFCQMSGFTSNEITGTSWTEQIPSEDLDRLVAYNKTRLTHPDQAPDKYEFTFYRKNGEIRHGLMSVSVIPSIRKIVASFADITERKNSEIQLQQYATELDHLNKGKDRLLSILAHDLKGPFSSLIGLSELLMLNYSSFSKEEVERQLQVIFQTTRKTYNLLEDLLLWSVSNLGKLPFEPQKVDLTSVCDLILEDAAFQANFKHIRMTCEGEEHVVLKADPSMLKVILRNLVSNAIKFCNTNGNIALVVRQEGAKAYITVTDDGVGIEPENLDKLWDLSKTYTTSGTAREKGTGLGLLLCRELVEKHGEKIWVESAVNKGTSFTFSMPLFVG